MNYFKLSDFDNAAIHINIALDKFPQSARVYFSLGCVYYWKALENLIYSKPIHGLTIFFHKKPKITFEQEEILQKAFEYFKKSYDCNNGQVNELVKIALCGCMYSSWIIGNTDYFQYHSKLLEIEPLNPAGIAFNWACNVLLDENIINEVEQKVISQPSDEILLTVLIWQFISDKQFERATTYLNMVSYKDNVSKNLISHLKIDIMLANDDNEEVLKVLTTCDISDEERKRIELQILISDKNSSKNSKINLAKELKTKYKTSIDYRNFCKVLMTYKKYKSVSKISTEWYNITKNISALFYNIFALYNLQEYEKCLELISELEKIANIDEQTLNIKSYCYINTSKLDEAIALIGNNGVPDDEDAAIQLARLYKSKGDLQRGISILIEFINNNNLPKNAAIELCEYLKSQDNNERFKYLDFLISKYPNDHRIKYEWFLCGMMTGHEQEVASYILEMQTHKNTKHKKNKLVPYTKILKGKEIIDFIKKQSEWQKKNVESFYNCSIPIHALLNNSNTLAQSYYNWCNELFFGLPIHYGGRRIELPDNYLYKQIVIDYTALLTMYSLELFKLLENHFDEIFISPNIFHIIDNEISILNNNQKFRYNAEKKLLDYINRNPSQITQVTSIKNVEEIDGVWEVDTYNYRCAKSVNALIVDSNSGTEMFYKNKLPKEYEESRISEYDIISFLQEKGLNIELPQKPKNIKVILHKINLKDNLLVDENFLTELQKQIDLSDITCLFNIFITERTYHSIKGGVDGVDNKKSCAEWLANLKELTQNLINKGVMKFFSVCPESEKTYKNNYPLLGLFEESFRFAYKENIGFWCDDRTFMSYGGINTPVILNALMKNELITVKEYYNVISKMLARGIYYYLPDVDYILNCLETTPLENEELLETSKLKNIRKAVAYALHESTFLSKNISKSSQFPESNEYMLNLHNIYDNVMTSIWNNKNKSIQWKFTSANWCLMYLSDFIWDVSFIEKNNSINGNVYIQFELLGLCLKFNSIEVQQQYCNWLFYWLRIRWQYNTTEPFELINKFASFLIDVTVEDIGYSIDDYQKIILLLLSRCFPDDFMYHLLHSPIFGGKWKNLIPFKIEEVKQSVINKENLFEQIDCDDLIEYYYINPEKWYDILFTATSKKDNPAIEIVAFMKRYIQAKGTEKITKECIEYIKLLTWVSPSDEKLAFQELKRMLL